MAPRDLPEPAFGLRALLPWHLLSSAAGDVPGWVPPARLAHLHVPELVASLWHRLIAAVREPAQVFDLNGQRVVMVAGIAAVRRQPDGALRVDVWRECDGRLQWVTSAPQTVVLQAMPAGWVWLDLIRDAAECELRRHLCQWGVAFEDTDLRIYARELFAHMRRRLVSHADLRQMRRRVAAALALDADAVRIARRVIDVAPGSGPGRVSAYNLVVRHLEAFRLLEREMPQAIPLYAAFVERPDFPSRGQPAQALREFLRSHEVGRCTWRLVVTAGPRLALPLRDFYAGDTAAAMLDYLRILQALRLRREPPPWLIWSILSRVAHPASRFQDHLRSLQRVAPLFGHAARACVAVRPEPVDDLPQVLEWLGTERPQLDKLQRRAGWPWLVARAREWMALRRREIEAQAQSWSTPFARMPIGAYDMVALQSVRDLWDEARAMHHCVDGFVDRCAAGDTLVVSVRSADEGGRRVATALYERQGQRWKLAQVRGVANRCPPREVETAAMFLAGMLNAPGQWPPEAKVKPPVEVGVPP
nr:PcfJ domain-containing protein [Burkholderiaceae bacterium]